MTHTSTAKSAIPYHIRLATASDVESIAKVHVATWRTAYEGIIDASYLAGLSEERRASMWREVIKSRRPREHVYVAVDSADKVLGFVSGGAARDGHGVDGEVYAIYVLKEVQQAGLGRKLLARSFARLQADGFSGAMLWVLEKNPSAAFYKKMGAVPGATKDEPIGDQTHTERLMTWPSLQESLTKLSDHHRHGCVIHCDEIKEPDWSSYPGSTEKLSMGSNFGRMFDFHRLGIHHELLLPGRRTSWPHSESAEDEFAYVIEGHPDVWIDGEVYPLKPGDGIGFRCGTGMAHTFINNTSKPVQLLVVGDRSREDNQVFYPLHPKRNEEVAARNLLWKDTPIKKLGGHNGEPTRG